MSEERVILHLSDWNLQDKYYEAPISLLKKFRKKYLEARKKHDEDKAIGIAWDWWTPQVDFGEKADKKKPIKFGNVNMTLEEFFLDWMAPDEGFNELMESLDEDEE